jgi:hypothetical protein
MTYSLDTQAMRQLRGARWSGISPTVYALGDREIAYSLPDDTTPAATNAWALAIDGSSAPRLLAPLAYSPAVVRR